MAQVALIELLLELCHLEEASESMHREFRASGDVKQRHRNLAGWLAN